MNKPNVLIIADKKDIEVLDTQRQGRHWNVFWKIVDYNRLPRKVTDR
jgi:hypothetical protein